MDLSLSDKQRLISETARSFADEVMRYLRDARVTTLYEGTSEIQKPIIGRAATGVDAILPFAPAESD